MKQFELKRKEELIFTGGENECYMKLQRVQSQSADWAMKYEGYTVTPVIFSGKKVFEFGKVDGYGSGRKTCLVTLEIELKDRNGLPVFTASGSVWNSQKSDILQGGQCIDSVYQEYRAQLANLPLYKKIMGLWERNHLNDMNAGTPEQTAAIEDWKKAGNSYDYSAACEYLNSIGLLSVIHEGKTYKYGHGWIYRAISNEDLQAIKELLA